MSAPRPDRCLTVLLPGDDPDAAAENPDLNEALHAGRPVIAFWQGDAGGRTKIAVLLGPVPAGRGRAPNPADPWDRMARAAEGRRFPWPVLGAVLLTAAFLVLVSMLAG